MSRYTIQCAGFDQPQREAMSAVIDLAESALTDEWSVLDSEASNTVMINLDADNGQQLCIYQLQIRQPYQIILVTEDQQALSDEHWFLLKKPDATPSLRSITQLLNQVSIRLAEESEKIIVADSVQEMQTSLPIQPEPKQESNTEPEPEEVITDDEEFGLEDEPPQADNDTTAIELAPNALLNDAEIENAMPASANNTKNIKLNARNFLYGLLLQAVKDKSCRIVQLNRLPPIFIEPENNAYYFSGSGEEMLAYCTTSRRFLKSKIISKTKLSKLMGVGLKASAPSLTELAIYAMTQASHGRLLEGHNPERPIKLTTLPDVKEIPLLGQYNEIAAFMSNWESDLYGVSEALQIPLAKVFEFYNACFLLGYIALPAIETESEPETANAKPVEIQSKRGLGRFFSTFFQNKGKQ